MTYVGRSTASNRVMVTLVIIAIAVVAIWAATGGFDRIQPAASDAVVVTG